MRCTQIFGLNNRAKEFLKNRAKRNETCPVCGNKISSDKAPYLSEVYKDESDVGMFNDGPMLNKYVLDDGSVAYEIIQTITWASGPCIFLCLEINGKKMFEWTNKEIDDLIKPIIN